MADDYSLFTDSDDDKAVEDILSQAMDHSILEQISAINCSSFSNSDLPSHLETRFRKLKSLPTTTAAGCRIPSLKSKSLGPRSGVEFRRSEQIPDEKKVSVSSPSTDSPEGLSDGNVDDKKGMKSKSNSNSNSKTNTDSEVSKQKQFKARSVSSPSTDSPEEQHSDGNLDEKKATKSKSNTKIDTNSEVFKQKRFKSTSGGGSVTTSDSDSGSPSPARRSIGCLWCSPTKKKRKSVCRKQGKENRVLSSSSSSWGNGNRNDFEFLKTFSIKEQQKIMKKAMKDEEKINREAAKIVKWAKQASARMMEVSGIDDDGDDEWNLSDLEYTNGK